MHTLQGQQSGTVGNQADFFFFNLCKMFFKTSSENHVTDCNCEIFYKITKYPKLGRKVLILVSTEYRLIL